MPVPTPATLHRALVTHRGAEDAFRALSVTRQAIYRKANGAHVHPELVALLREHAVATRSQRNTRGELGKHSVALPSEIVARLRAHGRRLSWFVRSTITAALRGPLPSPLAADRGMVVVLDLGATWGALGAAAGTDDPQRIAGILRGILASAGKVQALRDVASAPEKD